MKLPQTADDWQAETAWPVAYEEGTPARFPELGPSGGAAGLDVKRYLAALWRRKFLILAVTLVGTAGAVAGTRLIKPEYEAQATLWIEGGKGSGGGLGGGPIQQSHLLDAPGWLQLLRSYQVLDSVANKLKLYLETNPADTGLVAGFRLKEEFQPGEYRLTVDQDGGAYTLERSRGEVVERGEPGDSIGLKLGFVWAPPAHELWPGRRIELDVGSPRDASNELIRTLDARLDPNGSFMRLRLRGHDPKRIATILNAVSERYTDVAAQLKGAKLRELTTILDDQLEYALSNLQSAEADLERFRIQTITLPSERASPVNPGLTLTNSPAFANFFKLQTELDELRRDRDAIERALDQTADSRLPLETLDIIPSVARSSDLRVALGELIGARANLRALSLTLTERNPVLQKAKQDVAELEQSTIPLLVRRLLDDLANREVELERLIASAGSQLTEIPPRAIEEARHQRDVNIREQLFTTLQAHHENARLAAVSAIPDVRVLDAAIPPRWPINQKEAQRLIFMALLASLGLGVAGVILLDHFDPKLKYPTQVSHDLGLPILGTVPHVKSREGRGVLGNTSQVVESFRLIRLNLNHAYGTAGPVVIAVTSPAGQEGKSFVTANLGLSFADLGRRTLVIDGDVRRGHLHHLLGGSRKPGLTDYLMGRISRSQLVRPTAYANLDRIGSGTRRQDGPELLQSSAMASLLAQLRSVYDVILVDTPPIGAGADALALGTLTGNFLIVVRTGETDRELTEAKLDMLERLPVRLLGAVLNDVPDRGAYGAYYYAYSYLPGYEAVDEEESTDEVELIESVAASANSSDEDPGLGYSPEASNRPANHDAPDPSDDRPELPTDGLAVSVAEGSVAVRENGPDTSRGRDPQRELHRQHQRRSQVRQWK